MIDSDVQRRNVMPVCSCQLTNDPVEDEVKLGGFTKWLERKGGTLRETFDRNRVAKFLDCRTNDVELTAMITKEEIEAKAEEFELHPANVERDYAFGWFLAGL